MRRSLPGDKMRRMLRRTRQRLRTAALVVICLLFQQVALAAYLCPMEQMPPETMAMAGHCDEMGMAQEQDNPALCEKHCSPDYGVAADAAKLTVPPLALPAIVMMPVQVQSVSGLVLQADVPLARSDPPPRLRFCSLLI